MNIWHAKEQILNEGCLGRRDISDKIRLGAYLLLFSCFLLFLILVITQPIAEAWTSSNTGQMYTLKSIRDEVGNDSVVEPVGFGNFIVKEEIVIQNNDTLVIVDNGVYSNANCRFVIHGRCSVQNSTLKQNATNTNWLGFVVYENALATFSQSRIENASIGVKVGVSADNNSAILSQVFVSNSVFRYCDYGILGRNAHIELVNVEIRDSEFYGIYAEYSYLRITGLSVICDNGIGIHLKGCNFVTSATSMGIRIYNNEIGLDLYEQELSISNVNPLLIYQNGIGIKSVGGSLNIDGTTLSLNGNAIVAESCYVSLNNVQIIGGVKGVSATNSMCYIYNTLITNAGAEGITYTSTQGVIISSQIYGSFYGKGISLYSCSPIISDCRIENFAAAFLLVNSESRIVRTNVMYCENAYLVLSSKPKIIEGAIDMGLYVGFLHSSELYLENVKASTSFGFNCTYFSKICAVNSTLSHVESFYLYFDSHVTLLNTTYTGSVFVSDGYSTLVQQWYAHVSVVDALGNPLPGMQVVAKDGHGQNAFSTMTGADGTSYWNICTGLVISAYSIDTTISRYTFTTFLGNTYARTNEVMSSSKNITIVFNQAPIIVASIPDVHIFEDITLCNTTIWLGNYFSDLGLLTYSFNVDTNVTLSSVSGYLWAGTTIPNWYGSVLATVRATDNLGAYAECNFRVIVEPVNDAPTMLSIGTLFLMEDVQYVMDISSYISDIDTPKSQLIVSENSSYVTVNGHLLIFNYPNGILYDLVEVTVSDGYLSTTRTIEVIVEPVNDAPVILPIPAQFFFEDFVGILFYEEYIYDIDNPLDSLILSVDSIYVEIEYDEYELEFDYPNGITYQRVKLTVSDGLAFCETYIDVYITPVNDAPEIASIPTFYAVEDVPLTIDLSQYITDVDNHISELTIYDNSPYTTFNMHFITLLYPNGVLYDIINITVFDGEYSVSRTFEVFITPVNDAPKLIGIPSLFAYEDVPYELNLIPYILDEDTPLENISINVSSPYATIFGKFIIFTYPEGVTYERVIITVSDDEFSSSIGVIATITSVNDAPTILSDITVNAIEDTPYYLDLSNKIFDVDTAIAQLKLIVDSPYASILGMKLILCYPNGVNSDVFNISVSDGLSACSAKVTVNILPVNDAPEIKPLPTLTLIEDIEYIFDLAPYIIDVDNDLSSISIRTVSSNYAFVDGLKIRFTYPNGITTENVIITITDGAISTNAVLKITVSPVNDAPIISEISQINVIEDEEMAIDLVQYIYDEDNLISDLSIYTTSPNARVLGTILYIKIPNGITSQKINITVNDGKLSTSREFTVSVTSANDAAIISDLKVIPPANGDSSESYVFTVIYTDEENQAPNSISIYIDGKIYDLFAIDLSDINYTDGKGYMLEIKLKKGMHTYYVVAEDGTNKISTPSLSFYVAGENKQISNLANNSATNSYILIGLLLTVAFLCSMILLLVLKIRAASSVASMQIQTPKPEGKEENKVISNDMSNVQNENMQSKIGELGPKQSDISESKPTSEQKPTQEGYTPLNEEQNVSAQEGRNIRLQGKSGSAEIEVESRNR
ncbi:MAG: hypothetical protein QXT63_00705 [Thermoplasmata archaeon]